MKSYLEMMAKPGSWGDGIMLHVLSIEFNVSSKKGGRQDLGRGRVGIVSLFFVLQIRISTVGITRGGGGKHSRHNRMRIWETKFRHSADLEHAQLILFYNQAHYCAAGKKKKGSGEGDQANFYGTKKSLVVCVCSSAGQEQATSSGNHQHHRLEFHCCIRRPWKWRSVAKKKIAGAEGCRIHEVVSMRGRREKKKKPP
jgi:hypothetical protein